MLVRRAVVCKKLSRRRPLNAPVNVPVEIETAGLLPTRNSPTRFPWHATAACLGAVTAVFVSSRVCYLGYRFLTELRKLQSCEH